MGAFYRSKHELVFVFKNGTAPHINNFGLGQHGRYRTNVWDYAGVNSLKADRDEELAMHPTVKPVAMVACRIGQLIRSAVRNGRGTGRLRKSGAGNMSAPLTSFLLPLK